MNEGKAARTFNLECSFLKVNDRFDEPILRLRKVSYVTEVG